MHLGNRWADRASEVAAAEAEMRGRYTEARRQLGGLTREVQRLSRLLDEVPSQAELLQYERRFAELGEQVSEKLDETRKYFTLYNMLDRKRQYLVKQDSLLGSMEANFAVAMKVGLVARWNFVAVAASALLSFGADKGGQGCAC